MQGPPSVDESYTLRHPDWRHSFHVQQKECLEQLYIDQANGAKVQLPDGTWVESGGLRRDDFETIARGWAVKSLEEAIAREGDAIEVGRGL